METQFSRTEGLLGARAVERLKTAKIALFGVGGVGGYVAEALARSGVGRIDLFDGDIVQLTNLNRQIIALHSTLGMPNADAMAARLKDINPAIDARAVKLFYLPENADEVDLSVYDCVADAVDTVAAKTELICRCLRRGVKIFSAMGAGNKKGSAFLPHGGYFPHGSLPAGAGCAAGAEKARRNERRFERVFRRKSGLLR